MNKKQSRKDVIRADDAVPSSLPATGADAAPPWEEIENGRYMPRRIRGSYRGRELG
jgi:hypothetical protein